jgi:hypothetical protein
LSDQRQSIIKGVEILNLKDGKEQFIKKRKKKNKLLMKKLIPWNFSFNMLLIIRRFIT